MFAYSVDKGFRERGGGLQGEERERERMES
jgi:hypothetical protein